MKIQLPLPLLVLILGPDLQTQISDLRDSLLSHILPPDDDDARDAVLEVRSGVGGDWAAAFANDLLEMYRSYAAAQGWQFEVRLAGDRGGLRRGAGCCCFLLLLLLLLRGCEGSAVGTRLLAPGCLHRLEGPTPGIQLHQPTDAQLISATYNDFGGVKAADALIAGRGSFGRLRWESGTHRAQVWRMGFACMHGVCMHAWGLHAWGFACR